MPTLQPIRLPIPVHEAQVLIAICDDDIDRARGEARQNYRRAETDNEAAFWFGVIQVLTPTAQPQA
jgi:hypothetical protein